VPLWPSSDLSVSRVDAIGCTAYLVHYRHSSLGDRVTCIPALLMRAPAHLGGKTRPLRAGLTHHSWRPCGSPTCRSQVRPMPHLGGRVMEIGPSSFCVCASPALDPPSGRNFWSKGKAGSVVRFLSSLPPWVTGFAVWLCSLIVIFKRRLSHSLCASRTLSLTLATFDAGYLQTNLSPTSTLSTQKAPQTWSSTELGPRTQRHQYTIQNSNERSRSLVGVAAFVSAKV
jgi:hypothetical protein